MSVATPMTYVQARDLARALAAAIATRRVYGAEHPRTAQARALVLTGLQDAGDLRLLRQGDHLAWEGIPLRGNAAIDSLGERLGRDVDGLEMSRAARDFDLHALIEWLTAEGAGPAPAGAAVRILRRSAGPAPARPFAEFAKQCPEQALPLMLYHETACGLSRTMSQAAQGAIDVSEAGRVVARVADAIVADGANMLGPIHLVRSDTYTWQHSVNVFLISLSVLQHIAHDREDLLAMGQAALLHDIGKSRVPDWVINKPATLTPDERAIIERHPEQGADILAASDGIHPVSCEVAYCHHMRDGGHGYPTPRIRLKPGPVTEVVQVADMFEALTAWRAYKDPLPFEAAMRTIRTTPGMGSREAAITAVVRTLSAYPPPGALVGLADGRKAIVADSRTAAGRLVLRVVGSGEAVELPVGDPSIVSVETRHGLLGANDVAVPVPARAEAS